MAKKLRKLRLKIDKIDKKLLKTLAARFKITKKIGEYKAKYFLPVSDKERERKMLKERELLAKKLGLDRKLIKKIFQEIIKTVKVNHRKIKKRHKKETFNF